jgi:hypothetical protein
VIRDDRIGRPCRVRAACAISGRSGDPLIQETPRDARGNQFGTLVRFLAVNLTGEDVPSGFAFALRE